MSLISIFTRSAPQLGGLEFDAVLEDTLDAAVNITGYTVEAGAPIGDHRVILPVRWTLTGGVSDNPLTTSITDFTGALTSDLGGVGAGIAGLSAGFLAGGDQTRASSALELLLDMMRNGEPFDVDAGDIILKDMTIQRIRRTKNSQSEGALIFIAELVEWPTLKTALSAINPDPSVLPPGDPAQTQAAGNVSRGEVSGSAPSAAVASSVGGITA